MRIWGYYITIIEVAMERIAGRRGTVQQLVRVPEVATNANAGIAPGF